MRRSIVIAGVVLGVVVLTATLVLTVSTGGDERPNAPQPWPRWGFTHTQYSADYGYAEATRSVQAALAERPLVQVQALMGWGADNPEPSPGQYDFASLDQRIDLVRRSGGIPVITLCCAPDWMKGGTAGETDWGRLTVAPLREHYGDFAALAAKVAQRYPDVHYFLVWNELKGFWDGAANTWDASGYTDLYNAVYAAVKAANPHAEVGGPYVPMVTDDGSGPASGEAPRLQGDWGVVDPRVLRAFDYWLAHEHGADFVVVDGQAYVSKGDDPFVALQKFSAVNSWIKQRTGLPIWWAEWYVDPVVASWAPEEQRAVATAAMIQMAQSGTSTALFWNPTPDDSSCATCLWTDTRSGGGGRPLPMLTDVLQSFARWFPAGTTVQIVQAPPGLLVLSQPEAMVIVNTTGSTISTTIRGRSVRLPARSSQWITPS